MEFELSIPAFSIGNRYFDIFVEYAKDGRKTSWCGSRPSTVDRTRQSCIFWPTLWFRNDWSAWIAAFTGLAEKPILKQIEGAAGTSRSQ